MDALTVLLLWAALVGAVLGHGLTAVVLSALCAGVSLVAIFRGRWQAVPAAAMALLQLIVVLAAGSWTIALAALAVGHAFATLWLWWWPIPHLPVPSGAHAVGLRVVEFPLAGDPGDNTARADGRRWLQLTLWYPAQPDPQARPRPLQTSAEAAVLARAIRAIGGRGFILSHFRLARTHSHEGALAVAGSFPLVVFNHGGAMWPTQSSALMEALASHGLIVCSVAHPGESLGVVWRNGETTSIDPARVAAMAMGGDALRDQATFLISQDDAQRRMLLPSLEASFGPTLGEATRRWAKESIAAVDHLLAGTAEQWLGDVAARVDFSRLAYAGMSLGGSVALACCFLDPRARAGINLDGSNWCQEYLDLDVPVPFLQLYADPSVNLAMLKGHARAGTEAMSALGPGSRLYNDMFYEPPRRRGLRDDVLRIVLRNAAHMSFSDHALAARGPIRKLLGTGRSNGRRQQWLQAQLALGFLARHLKGGDGPALDKVLSESLELVRQRLEPEGASTP